MIVVAMLLIQATIPDAAEALRLPPAVAGERLLQGRNGRPIAAVETVPPGGLQLPEWTDLYLVERAALIDGRCERQRWTAHFVRAPGRPQATFKSAFSATEIALPLAGKCTTAIFVHVNPGLSNATAIGALRRMEAIRTGRDRPAITCRDETSSDLCASDRRTRTELARLAPWVVTRENGAVTLWLGTPGQIVTEVRFDLAADNRINVARRIPPPA